MDLNGRVYHPLSAPSLVPHSPHPLILRPSTSNSSTPSTTYAAVSHHYDPLLPKPKDICGSLLSFVSTTLLLSLSTKSLSFCTLSNNRTPCLSQPLSLLVGSAPAPWVPLGSPARDRARRFRSSFPCLLPLYTSRWTLLCFVSFCFFSFARFALLCTDVHHGTV